MVLTGAWLRGADQMCLMLREEEDNQHLTFVICLTLGVRMASGRRYAWFINQEWDNGTCNVFHATGPGFAVLFQKPVFSEDMAASQALPPRTRRPGPSGCPSASDHIPLANTHMSDPSSHVRQIHNTDRAISKNDRLTGRSLIPIRHSLAHPQPGQGIQRTDSETGDHAWD